ncbi:hypothetical protein [Pseudoprimorskyibacter insulae]|uniref:Uncharacterized protein n=1 Tax=Pseudoprimorskyibacter insulae TaxID=1695997 RepID=A0A2R8AYJ3_9RHOB|nr:hypothetical protein [Pseudoprimorskyibacter insulae]SPF81101.1 hypothetical protein PRI8871_02919 [Pseudoprimorskyibacter insulae]
MHYFVCIAALLLIAPNISMARIVVKSGLHENFARLVFYHDLSFDWSITLSDKILSVEFLEFDGEIDTSEVFKKIPMSRIQTVATMENKIVFGLGCACVESHFVLSPGILVLDISDPPTVSSLQTINLNKEPTSARIMRLSVSSSEIIAGLKADFELAKKKNFIVAKNSTQSSISSADQKISPQSVNFSDEEPVRSTECRREEEFGIVIHLSESDYSGRLSQMRANILTDSANTNIEVAKDLIGLYIEHGLAAEALKTINSLNVVAPSYTYMANVIKNDVPTLALDGTNIGSSNCSADPDIWSALATGFSSKAEADEYGLEIIRQLGELPTQLKQIFTPRLVDTFIAAGATGLAETLIPAARRNSEISSQTSELLLSQAAPPNPEKTSEKISAALEEDRRSAAIAISTYFNTIESVKNAEPDQRSLLYALEKEYLPSPLGPSLIAARIRLIAFERKQKDLLTALRRNDNSGAVSLSIWNEVVEYASSEYGDIEFLKLAFALKGSEISGLNERTREQFSGRLSDLGFEDADSQVNGEEVSAVH